MYICNEFVIFQLSHKFQIDVKNKLSINIIFIKVLSIHGLSPSQLFTKIHGKDFFGLNGVWSPAGFPKISLDSLPLLGEVLEDIEC